MTEYNHEMAFPRRTTHVRSCGIGGAAGRGPGSAVAEVLKAGGSVRRDLKQTGKPIVCVELTACTISEAGLEQLRFLTDLQTLDL